MSVRPAATLLVPWFGVDLAAQDGLTTMLSITNVDSRPHLVSVTLWTDWAVPTLTFNLYLTGFDVQTLNLRDILKKGVLPATGVGSSPVGGLSDGAVAFPGCAAAVAPARVAARPLQRSHTGRKVRGLCHGQPAQGRRWRQGMSRWTSSTPARRSIPRRPATSSTAGRGWPRTTTCSSASTPTSTRSARPPQGEQAVHIVADAEAYGSGYTFYGRYVSGDGRDNRQPLGSRFAASYAQGGPQGMETVLTIWRDTKSAAALRRRLRLGAGLGAARRGGAGGLGRGRGGDVAAGVAARASRWRPRRSRSAAARCPSPSRSAGPRSTSATSDASSLRHRVAGLGDDPQVDAPGDVDRA